jgi:hypothetical protein
VSLDHHNGELEKNALAILYVIDDLYQKKRFRSLSENDGHDLVAGGGLEQIDLVTLDFRNK